MIEFVKGDLFKSKAEALVNPVNCVGGMGKGLAKAFKERWPEMDESYRRSCAAGQLQPGSVLLYPHSVPKIVLFATKGNWRQMSQYVYIHDGLRQMKAELPTWMVSSVAMPAIGCGLGGLSWKIVKGLIETHLRDVPTKVEVYEPE
jgi:O-acetyl-ADP-ribose deacetylase (regulator of RNase III)